MLFAVCFVSFSTNHLYHFYQIAPKTVPLCNVIRWGTHSTKFKQNMASLLNLQISRYPALLLLTALSTSLQALQQYFLKRGTAQFLFNSSGRKYSQYCVASAAGQAWRARAEGGHRRRRQRRWRSRGFGPQQRSSDAGQDSGRQDQPRPQLAEHWYINRLVKYSIRLGLIVTLA